MRRRELLIFLAVVRPSVTWAAQPVIGFLGSGSPTSYGPFVAAFREGLSDNGFIEGQNVAIEFRWAGGRFDRLPALAADLVGRKVNVIVTSGGTPSARAAHDATTTIPIVFSGVTDPVGVSLVASLAQPGGNMTGLSDISSQLTPKRLELLIELVPQAKVIGLLVNPNAAVSAAMIRDVRAAVPEGMRLEILNASSDSEIDTAFSLISELGVGAIIVASDPFYSSRRDQLVALSLNYSVPAIYTLREFVLAGGLINYGASISDTYRQQGVYTAKILSGVKPAELPIVQATKFDLAINLKTASALGISISQSLRDRAELIE